MIRPLLFPWAKSNGIEVSPRGRIKGDAPGAYSVAGKCQFRRVGAWDPSRGPDASSSSCTAPFRGVEPHGRLGSRRPCHPADTMIE